MNLNTERLILRKTTLTDCDNMFNLLNDPEIVKYLNMNIHHTKEDTKKLIEEYLNEYQLGNKYPFTIITKDTNEFVGIFLIKLDLYDEDCYEFTIYLDKKYWGKGIYKEVLPYMMKYAFEVIKTGNFRGFVMENNVASSKVLEYCHFKLEKVFNVPNIEGNIKSYLMTKDNYLSLYI